MQPAWLGCLAGCICTDMLKHKKLLQSRGALLFIGSSKNPSGSGADYTSAIAGYANYGGNPAGEKH